MIDLLLKNSGFYIDENEHNMFESELGEMIEHLEILSEICETDTNNRAYVHYCELREDKLEKSSPKSDILMNSKLKTDVGYKVYNIK